MGIQKIYSASEQWAHNVLGIGLGWGQMGPQLRVREKSKCTRLKNVESESKYDPRRKLESIPEASVVNWPIPNGGRTKEKQRWLNILSWPYARQSKEVRLSENILSQPVINLGSSWLFLFIQLFCKPFQPFVNRGCPCGIMVKVMNCGIVVNEFEFQSRYYVYFWTNTLGKGMNPLTLPAMG